ncbi:hypothetical protein ALI22I_17450 [Saccharothrix sp. ALI-22-I]|nr:hypothetical protein ALI22I_17450 [Saccharothrix sp. ALI-22-I]
MRGLCGVVDAQRAEQGDAVLASCADHQVGGGVTGVHDVLAGQQTAAFKIGVDSFEHFHVGDGRVGVARCHQAHT